MSKYMCGLSIVSQNVINLAVKNPAFLLLPPPLNRQQRPSQKLHTIFKGFSALRVEFMASGSS